MVVDSTIRFNDRMDGPSVSLGSKLSNAKVSFAIFKRDIKRLLVNPVALVVTLGVCVIPSLYAWYNIVANWDPYGNTQGIKIAIANNDQAPRTTWWASSTRATRSSISSRRTINWLDLRRFGGRCQRGRRER